MLCFCKIKLLVLVILALVTFSLPTNLLAAMSSADYYIYADTVDTGGIFSTGGDYTLDSSAGESSPAGFSNNGTYEMRGGYQAMDRGYINIYISDASLSLGTLNAAIVGSASTVATISTNASTGYVLQVGSVSGTALASVADGSVTAGSEEYGVSGAGAQNSISGDVAVAAALILASSTVAIDGSATTFTFKAAMSPSSVAGDYSQIVTLSASANF